VSGSSSIQTSVITSIFQSTYAKEYIKCVCPETSTYNQHGKAGISYILSPNSSEEWTKYIKWFFLWYRSLCKKG
jgi:hypothetical protein